MIDKRVIQADTNVFLDQCQGLQQKGAVKWEEDTLYLTWEMPHQILTVGFDGSGFYNYVVGLLEKHNETINGHSVTHVSINYVNDVVSGVPVNSLVETVKRILGLYPYMGHHSLG